MSTPPAGDTTIDRRRELTQSIVTFAVTVVAFSAWYGNWRFGLGLALLILVHELGHFVEARRQGLQALLPRFRVFFAYVLHERSLTPWKNALISLAGPLAGGLGALAVWAVGSAQNSHLLIELAFWGFVLNAVNLIPIGIFDGGGVARSIAETWRRPSIRYEHGIPIEARPPEHDRAIQIAVLYVLLVAGLVGCVLAVRQSVAY